MAVIVPVAAAAAAAGSGAGVRIGCDAAEAAAAHRAADVNIFPIIVSSLLVSKLRKEA